MALTKQQQVFAAGVAQGMTQRDAAIAAGYSAKSADAQASQMLKNPKVAAELARMRAKSEIVAVGSKAELLNMVWARLAKSESDRDFTALSRLWFDATGAMVIKQEIKTDQVVELAWAAPIEAEDEDAEQCE